MAEAAGPAARAPPAATVLPHEPETKVGPRAMLEKLGAVFIAVSVVLNVGVLYLFITVAIAAGQAHKRPAVALRALFRAYGSTLRGTAIRVDKKGDVTVYREVRGSNPVKLDLWDTSQEDTGGESQTERLSRETENDMNWSIALDILCALRDAFPGEHPSLSLDRETRGSLLVLLNPEPGKVYQYRLDPPDFTRSVPDVIGELKACHAARKSAEATS